MQSDEKQDLYLRFGQRRGLACLVNIFKNVFEYYELDMSK